MCSSKIKSAHAINGRAVLQPPSNRVFKPADAPPHPIKKTFQRSPPLLTTNNINVSQVLSPPISPKPKPAVRLDTDEKPVTPKKSAPPLPVVKKLSNEARPGSIAAAQREQATLAQAQRKMKIAHYGRTSAKLEQAPQLAAAAAMATAAGSNQEERRCSFITPNSDSLYVAYHDEEWGVPVHDDCMLFELLALSGLQVGLDWVTILKRRNEFRSAFAGFHVETVANFTERQISYICTQNGLDIAKVRGIVDNANRILEVKKSFGSFDKYLWGFVNYKPLATNYKSCRKIPVKTSKSETISKDMVRRGFRLVGPTVVHSFMQAAGLTNDHLVSCPRHQECC